MTTHIIIPTYKETTHVKELLSRYEIEGGSSDIILYFVNSNSPDDTTQLLRSFKHCGTSPVFEIPSSKENFWTATINIGLRYVLSIAGQDDYIGLANADVGLSAKTIKLLKRVSKDHKDAVTFSPSVSSGRIVSTGVWLRSAMLYRTVHVYLGAPTTVLDRLPIRSCDFAPTRLIVFPQNIVRRIGFPDELRLPHYTADYEYTARLKRHGIPLLLVPSAYVEVDLNNTGYDSGNKKLSLLKRITRILDLKSSYNPKYRTIFILKTFNWYAIPTALVVCWLKTAGEVLLGQQARRLMFRLNRVISTSTQAAINAK